MDYCANRTETVRYERRAQQVWQTRRAQRGARRIQEIIAREGAALYRPMPWRHIDDPYAVLLSEVMLQQTQVARVLRIYPRFLERFPTVEALAAAPTVAVVAAWQGLGYNRRALFLKRAAERIVAEHGGAVPQDYRELCALPGIGAATAGAIRVYAHNIPTVFIETNIRRVFIFYCFTPDATGVDDRPDATDVDDRPDAASIDDRPDATDVDDRSIEPLARQIMPATNCREWYYALTDLGASLVARVGHNPNARSRGYTRQAPFEGSVRQLRGAILRDLTAVDALPIAELPARFGRHESETAEVLQALQREGFIVAEKGAVYLKK